MTGGAEQKRRRLTDLYRHLIYTQTNLALRFGIIVFPGFQALDAFGPLDILNTLAWDTPLELSIIADTLDPVSTLPPTSVPAPRPAGNSSQSIVPTHTYDAAPQLDVLLVPGGRGTRSTDNVVQRTIDFIARVYPSLKYLITVCTGAGLAARAGVLDGKRATTNKMSWAPTIALGPRVKWIAHARWVVDGKNWTSSGVSAGLDVAFAFVEEVYGKEVAEKVATILEYERHTDSSWDPFAELYGLKDSDCT